MARITGEDLIDAAITEVFDTVADERNEPRYNPRIVRAEMLTHEPVGAGSRFVAEPKRMGARGRMALEIVEYQRPHRLHNVICSSYAHAHGTLTFAETDGAAHGCGGTGPCGWSAPCGCSRPCWCSLAPGGNGATGSTSRTTSKVRAAEHGPTSA
ncbi:SRPBCC family protein [Rhodococcus opacus]|uniref:SRPBCC family protein n=1 Tax=Rhodococcus opacus TaxID=37919 RepID=A0AAX3YSQ7_RHOOP|nr:SRPBCC family protein [Rhodococcus opacus]MCZ4590588.1 SRPBCC family protein [Rhodococcus opacus]WLF52100.1 SRPBCC family protein [Rhodococcus opacus]